MPNEESIPEFFIHGLSWNERIIFSVKVQNGTKYFCKVPFFSYSNMSKVQQYIYYMKWLVIGKKNLNTRSFLITKLDCTSTVDSRILWFQNSWSPPFCDLDLGSNSWISLYFKIFQKKVRFLFFRRISKKYIFHLFSRKWDVIFVVLLIAILLSLKSKLRW